MIADIVLPLRGQRTIIHYYTLIQGGLSEMRVSLRYDQHGRKRKNVKSLSTRKRTPEFRDYEPKSSDNFRDTQQYPSAKMPPPSKNEGRKKIGGQYTGTYVIGIGTMHKSNAVPITSKEAAREISEMIK